MDLISSSIHHNRHKYLFRIFVSFSLLAALLILVLVSASIYKIYKDNLISSAEDNAINLGYTLLEQEQEFLLAVPPGQTPKVHVPQDKLSTLDEHMRKYLRPLGVIKIKVYSKDKEIVYSTAPSIIGAQDKGNKELDRALQGEIFSRIQKRSTTWDLHNEEHFNLAVIETYCPFKWKNNEVIGVFEIYKIITKDQKQITRTVIACMIIIFVILVCIFGILIVLMKHAINTIMVLTEKERELASAKAAAKTEKAKAAEIAALYAELKIKHQELKDTQEQLIQAEKLEVIGNLASGIAHEVKNPLAILLQSVDYLINILKPTDENISSTLQNMIRAIQKADRTVRQLLDFSRVSQLDVSVANLNDLLEQSLELMKYELTKRTIKATTIFREDLPSFKVDKNKLEHVFINIFMNAAQAMDKDGALHISTDTECDAENNITHVVVEVKDTGPGIAPEVAGKIFEPFISSKHKSGGTGLGMSIVKNIIDLHKGSIEIKNRDDAQGAHVIIKFPLHVKLETKKDPAH